MIKFRAKNPDIIDTILPKLVAEVGIDKETAAAQIKRAMTENPEYVFTYVAFVEDELIAFLVAYAIIDRDHVFVYQAWTEAPKEVSAEIMQELEKWTAEVGVTQIRMETTRSPRAFARRFGFKPFTQIMAKDITQETE